jgi:hypothetical protein
MILKPGVKLHSATCDTAVVVIRAPETDLEVACGGAPMHTGDESSRVSLHPGPTEGTLLGKRYFDEDAGIELLCIRAGAGALTCDGRPIPVKSAKPLPSSD